MLASTFSGKILVCLPSDLQEVIECWPAETRLQKIQNISLQRLKLVLLTLLVPRSTVALLSHNFVASNLVIGLLL